MKRNEFLKLIGGFSIAATQVPALADFGLRNNRPLTLAFIINGGTFSIDFDHFIHSIKDLNSNLKNIDIHINKNIFSEFNEHNEIRKTIPFSTDSQQNIIKNAVLELPFDSLTTSIGKSEITKANFLIESLKTKINKNYIIEFNSTDVGHYSNKQYRSQINLESSLISQVIKELDHSGLWHIQPIDIYIINTLVREISIENHSISHHICNGNPKKSWSIKISNHKMDQDFSKHMSIESLIKKALI